MVFFLSSKAFLNKFLWFLRNCFGWTVAWVDKTPKWKHRRNEMKKKRRKEERENWLLNCKRRKCLAREKDQSGTAFTFSFSFPSKVVFMIFLGYLDHAPDTKENINICWTFNFCYFGICNIQLEVVDYFLTDQTRYIGGLNLY